MVLRVSFKNSRGERLAGILHLPQKHKRLAGVILCHGLAGGKDLGFIPQVAEALEKNNIIALHFDFSGNGESEGEFSQMTYTKMIDDLRAAVEFLNHKGIKRIGVTGHSLGAAICLLTTAFDHRIKAVASSAPVVFPWATHTRKLSRGEKLMLQEKGYVVREDENRLFKLDRKFFEDAKRQNVLKNIQKIRKPILILQGSQDEAVYLQEVKKLYQVIPSDVKKLVIFPGSNHRFDNIPSHRKQLIDWEVNWFKKYLARESNTVTSFLENQRRILILKRSSKIVYPGLWNGISGYVNPVESPAKRAIKEIEEEVGIKAKYLRLVKTGKPYRIIDNSIDKVWISHPLLFHTISTKIKLDWEHTDYCWIRPEDLKKFKTVPRLEVGLKRVM